jgi:hypothetical protein
LASLLDDNESKLFSNSIRAYFEPVNREIDRLTADQYRVIRQLRYVNRVRVSGCAGSGKTLVAAEKSIRLADAGMRVLFLCHSPLLADYVRNLTIGSNIDVFSFSNWIFGLAQQEYDVGLKQWTNYEEPYSDAIEGALRCIEAASLKYNAVVVDEGQDFRAAWWTVVQAALADGDTGMLYIFHDDAQSLLPFRTTYPITSPVIDLSRNCRNAGKIYDVVRTLYPQAPETELKLAGEGVVEAYSSRGASIELAVSQALRRLAELNLLERAVLLIGGSCTVESIGFCGADFPVRGRGRWQEAVRRLLVNLQNYNHRGVQFQYSNRPDEVGRRVAELSGSFFPTKRDIRIVNSCAGLYHVDIDVRRRIQSSKVFRSPRWRQHSDTSLHFSRQSYAPIWAAEIILFLSGEAWVKSLPAPETVRLRAYYEVPTECSLPMYDLSTYKGLEADAVILVFQGFDPLLRQSIYVGLSRARHVALLISDQPSSIEEVCPTLKFLRVVH